MSVAVYIVNTLDATEVAIDSKSGKEISIVNYNYPDAVPVRIVSSGVVGVIHTKIVHPRFITIGETLLDDSEITIPNNVRITKDGDYRVTKDGSYRVWQ